MSLIRSLFLSRSLNSPIMPIELNDTEYSRLNFNMTVRNMYPTAIVYNLSSVGAATVNPFIEGDDSVQMDTIYTTNFGSVQFSIGKGFSSQMLLSVPAGKSAVVKVKFSPPADAKPTLFPIFSGYVTVTATGLAASNPKVSVPYAGMVGRWKQAAVWSRQSALGATGMYDPVTGEGVSDGGSVSAVDGSILLFAVSTSSRFGQVEVLNHADNSRYIAVVDTLDSSTSLPTGVLKKAIFYPLARMAPIAQPTIGSTLSFLWNGLVTSNKTSINNIELSPGQYTISFVAQRHFATATDPLDVISTTINLVA